MDAVGMSEPRVARVAARYSPAHSNSAVILETEEYCHQPNTDLTLTQQTGASYTSLSDTTTDEEDVTDGLVEDGEEGKVGKKINIFKGVFDKKTVTMKEEKKGGRIGQIFRKSPDLALTSSTESLQIKEEEEDRDNSKLRRLKTGLGRKLKDLTSDMQDIRDGGIHTFNEFKVEYQERADRNKAIITSFTDEEVKSFRKSSPLPTQVTKQMSCMYVSKRHTILRVSILSVEGLTLPMIHPEPTLTVKLSLGPERFKTRQVAYSCSPSWRETSCLSRHSAEDDLLRFEVLARGSKETMVLGVATVQLCKYPQDTCTRLSLGLEHGVEGEVQEGVLSAILWVTGGDTAGDGPQNYPDRAETADRFGLFRTLEDIESVGTLTVTVVEAAGLGLSKLQGSVNPFCVLEMDNQFHRTRTMTKTKVPVWDRTFHFHVRDPFTVLRLAVISEKINSPQGNTELILGRAALLVSSLHSTGGHTQDMWINLKDRKLRKPAKGENPRIHLRVSYIHNKIRAAVAVFWNPEEKLYEVEKPKFERSTLLRNVSRIKGFLPKGSTIQKLKQSYTDIIAWKEPARTVKFFIFYMFFVYYFQIWWIPAATLYQLITNYRNRRTHHYQPSMVPRLESMEEEEEEEEDKEEKKSIKQSIDSFQNTLQEFQECCGLVASYLEKVSNMAHFQEVFLSCLFCMVLLVASLILYILGLRSVLLLWGVNKFTKKLRESDPVPTNEIDNLILRVPDYELLEDCRDVFPSSGSPSPS